MSPELVGVSEIAEAFGVAKNTAWRWTARNNFPKPIAKLEQGRVWLRADVDRWAKEHRPMPGRPRKTT